MKIVEFFGTKIKPKKTKGKHMFHPLENGLFNKQICFIRDKDVNAYFIKSDSGFIAIDSGYKNSANMEKGLAELSLEGKVHNVLLTHLDLDHAGGVDKDSKEIYPGAKVFLGREEAKYLTKEYARKEILGLKLASPIQLRDGYTLLDDEEEITIDGVKIKAFLTPGHTLGHVSYLIDNYLFVGDTLILKDNVGYCFWDFWNANSEMNKASLDKLYNIAKANDVKIVFTSHNGYSTNIEDAFKHRDQYIAWNKKGFIFDETAPFDVYKD